MLSAATVGLRKGRTGRNKTTGYIEKHIGGKLFKSNRLLNHYGEVDPHPDSFPKLSDVVLREWEGETVVLKRVHVSAAKSAAANLRADPYKLNHAAILALEAVFLDEEYVYVQTKFMKGGNLKDWVTKQGSNSHTATTTVYPGVVVFYHQIPFSLIYIAIVDTITTYR